jgi:hypothetical protein
MRYVPLFILAVLCGFGNQPEGHAGTTIQTSATGVVQNASQKRYDNRFVSYKYGFAIKFPTTPRKLDLGEFVCYQANHQEETCQYFVHIHKIPGQIISSESIESYLSGKVKGAMAAPGSPKLLNSKRITFREKPAIKYEADLDYEVIIMRKKAITLLGKSDVGYTISVLCPKSKTVELQDSIDAFFDSFEIVQQSDKPDQQ